MNNELKEERGNGLDKKFTHSLYDVRPPWNGEGHFYYLVSSLFIKLGMRKLYRVKANLNPKTIFRSRLKLRLVS